MLLQHFPLAQGGDSQVLATSGACNHEPFVVASSF